MVSEISVARVKTKQTIKYKPYDFATSMMSQITVARKEKHKKSELEGFASSMVRQISLVRKVRLCDTCENFGSKAVFVF